MGAKQQERVHERLKPNSVRVAKPATALPDWGEFQSMAVRACGYPSVTDEFSAAPHADQRSPQSESPGQTPEQDFTFRAASRVMRLDAVTLFGETTPDDELKTTPSGEMADQRALRDTGKVAHARALRIGFRGISVGRTCYILL